MKHELFSTSGIFALALVLSFFSAGQSSPSKNDKNVDNLGIQVQEQPSKPAENNSKQKTISSDQARELFRSVDELLKFASQDTGLPIKHDVQRELIGRDQLQSYVEKNMRDDKDAQRLKRSEVVLKKFGLLPRDFDLSAFLVKMLREQVAAYYDPKTNTVNMLNWLDADQQKPVLAHELTHALQDQSFSIEKWMRSPEDLNNKKEPSAADIREDEALAARQAVIEGQAMAVLLDYSLAPSGQSLIDSPQIAQALEESMMTGTPDSPSFNSAPIFLKETLTFPYRYGLEFTAALLGLGGKDLAFSKVFDNPPTSTRELMEPKTYLEHEKLPPMKMLDLDTDFSAYTRFDIGAMGEFDVDVLVEQYAGDQEAKPLYPEWRGGYYFAGKSKSDKSAPIALVYVSRWSEPARAAEFAGVYAKSLAKRYQHVQALGSDGKPDTQAPPVDSWRMLRGNHSWQTEEGPVVIEVREDQVFISESMDQQTTKRAATDFWGAQSSVQP